MPCTTTTACGVFERGALAGAQVLDVADDGERVDVGAVVAVAVGERPRHLRLLRLRAAADGRRAARGRRPQEAACARPALALRERGPHGHPRGL